MLSLYVGGGSTSNAEGITGNKNIILTINKIEKVLWTIVGAVFFISNWCDRDRA